MIKNITNEQACDPEFLKTLSDEELNELETQQRSNLDSQREQHRKASLCTLSIYVELRVRLHEQKFHDGPPVNEALEKVSKGLLETFKF